MQNFFKKLTSSFKMGEDDIFNDDPKNEETSNEESPESNESEAGETQDGEEETDLEEAAPESEEEERPYTIAQLAKTKTKETPISIYSKGGSGENESNVPEGQLAIDVYETPSEIVVKSTIAGAKPEDLDIGIEDSTVNIRGSRHNEEKVKGENYLYQECYWGTFSRSIILPTEVDSDKAEASLKDGVLTLRIPKVVKVKEKKIRVVA